MDSETYKVEENDSIFSISLKFNMPVYNLLRLNKLNEESLIFPGMLIKVKQGVKKLVEQEILEKMDLNRIEVYYCSKEGDVRGILSHNEFVLMFTPNCVNSHNCLIKFSEGLQEKESLDYHQCVDLRDILSINLVEYPGFAGGHLQQDQLYLKVSLARTDNKEEISKLGIAKGTIYFRVRFT